MNTHCEICADTRLHGLNNLERCDTCAVLPDDLTARRLAAAAPELLAALVEMEQNIRFLVEDGTLTDFALTHPAMVDARAAIAKATGGEAPEPC